MENKIQLSLYICTWYNFFFLNILRHQIEKQIKQWSVWDCMQWLVVQHRLKLDMSDILETVIDILCTEEVLELQNNPYIHIMKELEVKHDEGRISSLCGQKQWTHNQRETRTISTHTLHWVLEWKVVQIWECPICSDYLLRPTDATIQHQPPWQVLTLTLISAALLKHELKHYFSHSSLILHVAAV